MRWGEGRAREKGKKREGFRKHVKTGDEKTRAKRTRGQGGGMTEEEERRMKTVRRRRERRRIEGGK